MQYLDFNNPVIVLTVLSGLIAFMLLVYLGWRLNQSTKARHMLEISNNENLTKIALTSQQLEQLEQQNVELKTQFNEARHRTQMLNDNLHTAEKNIQSLEKEIEKNRELSDQKLQQFEENRRLLKIEFENLAGKILDEKSRAFHHSNQGSIETLLKPFREQIEGFQKRVNDLHSDSVKGNAALESEIKKVLEVGLKMGSDAKNLTSALKGDSQKRGGWGEAQLERTLEMSGLIPGTHFEKQSSFKDEDGRRKQTDFLINVPGGKQMIIDSKVSLVAYDRVVAAESSEAQNLALSEHAKSVKRHIDDLAGKDYTNLIGMRSPGFVLMFMPIEPAYIEALKFEKDLFSYGYDKNIVLVSHTTLIPILRTVANLWMMERSTKEAREISEKAGDVYNQVCEVATRLKNLGGSLSAVTNHYNSTMTALVGRQGLHGKVERFALLSSKVSKSMPVLEPLHKDLNQDSLSLNVESVEPETVAETVSESGLQPVDQFNK